MHHETAIRPYLVVFVLMFVFQPCENALNAQTGETESGEAETAGNLDVVPLRPDDSQPIQQTQFEQPLPVPPPADISESRRQPSGSLFHSSHSPKGLLSRTRRTPVARHSDVISGSEAKIRASTDAGSLLGKSPTALGVGVQKRNPIVTDTRVRGSRVGQLLASGSYWVPARMDLDTMLSKIDSRIIDEMIVIKGPYSSRHGPGLNFVDVTLLPSPRFANGYESHGRSSLDYKTNGKQWYGRQTALAGSDNWGMRVGYGHRTGNDYSTGDGDLVASSYKSRDVDVALGFDLPEDRHVEFSYLRLDQTDVEYPGQVFDMDYLVTDAFELKVVDENAGFRMELDSWFNRTRFQGNSQGGRQLQQFEIFDLFKLSSVTDVDSTSTGFSLAGTWGDQIGPHLTFGLDTRYVKQELNELTTVGIVPGTPTVNSPIPRSHSANPGIFAEFDVAVHTRFHITWGARLDWVATDIIDDQSKLGAVGFPEQPIQETYGTNNFDRDFLLWSAFVTGHYELNRLWTLSGGFGHAERPPTLTELYAAGPFLFVLQNGVNGVIGDPTLNAERSWQIDIGLDYDDGRIRAGANGFYSWINDYITFENVQTLRLDPNGIPDPDENIDQIALIFINTQLATLSGFETYTEYDWNKWATTFATLRYVEGRDHNRNGEFATRTRDSNPPTTATTTKIPGQPRGSLGSGTSGGSKESLPSIIPLESRIGLRIHDPNDETRWAVEFSARIVDNQDRVARSLEEKETAGFTVYDLRSYWRARDGWLLVFGVENLTDKQYREHLNFIADNGFAVFQPGISFNFGSELTY